MDLEHLITNLVLIGAVIVFAYHAGGEAFFRRRLHRRTVIVVLKDNSRSSYRGVLWRQTSRHLELRNAYFLDGANAAPIDGSVILPRGNVAWIQDPREET